MIVGGITAWAQNAVSTLAGSGSAGSADGTGTAASFQLTNPSGAAVDSSGNIFIADAANHTIRKITSAGVVTTFAGTAGSSGSTDGTGVAARFNTPRGIAADGAGNLYVADTNNHTIRMITSAGVVTTLAGSAGTSGSTNGTGAAARFSQPFGIAADRAGAGNAAVNVFVADTQNHMIRQVVVASGVVTTLAGTAGTSGNANGTGAAATFNHPDGIASNAGGTTLYVTDTFNHLVRQIVVSSAAVTTLAGSGIAGQTDATGTAASFDNPTGVAIDGVGNVLIADTFNHTIRSITSAGVVTTYAGLADASGSTNGLASNARFNFPSGLAFSSSNSGVYIADTNNQLVRVITGAQAPSITAQPASVAVAANGNASFTVSATGNPPVSYQWQIQPGGTGAFTNLTASSTYTGVASATLTVTNVTSAMNGDKFQVVVSNGVGSAATSSAATLTVTQLPAFTSAATANFVINQTTTFQVTATGSPAPTLSSGILPSWASFNTSTGVLTGHPITGDTSANITFTATNSVGSVNQTFAATVVTTTVPALSIVANQQVASGGTTASFSVTATGSPTDFTYQWQRSTDDGATWTTLTNATIDGATYSGATAAVLGITNVSPSMNGNRFRVVVTSSGGTTTSNAALLGVAPVITSLSSYTFVIGQSNSFTFQAAGSPAPTISISVSGSLPNGITFNSPVLSGTPTDTFSSTTFMTVTATNSGGTGSQSFTLNVSSPQAPVITSGSNASFNVGQAGTFTFTATGSPTPTLQLFGSLPTGVAFNSSTGVLSGTPTDTAGSPFTLTLQASNSVGTVSQTFTLTVLGVAPTITSHPANVTANVGQTVTFSATATGSATLTLRWQRQPSGTSGFVNLSDDGVYSGTTTNTLTIASVTAAMSLDQFRLVASNGTLPDAVSNPAQLTINLGTVITTLAGLPGFFSGTDGVGVNARFNSPSHVAVDNGGTIYVADTANHVIRKVTSGGTVTTLAGLAGFSGSTDGTGSDARFNSPQGVAVDGAGNIYVADTFNHTIRWISPVGVVTTIAGSVGLSGAVDANGSSARFNGPTAVATDAFGNLYVSDTSNHAIRRVTTSRDVSTFAGLMGNSGYADGTGTAARFTAPGGVTVDPSGNVYVADSLNQVIRKIASGGVVTTLAGGVGAAGINDGIGTAARFNRPTGIAADGSGNLYITDTFSSTIRKLVINTGDVSTIAGSPVSTGSTDGAGSTARFNQPVGIASDYAGNLYIADTRNHTIRRNGSPIAPQIQTQPLSKVAPIGQTVTFTAAASGAPLPGYQWQRAAAGSGIFVNLTNDATYSGVTTATLNVANVTAAMSGDQFRVIANNGVSPVATSNAATLTVGTAPVFTSAASASFRAGEAGTFNVTVTSDPAASFSLSGNPSWLSINSSTGVLSGTPPDTSGSPLSFTITANNGIGVSQTFSLTILPAQVAPTITTQPVGGILNQGDTASFSVVATGIPAPTYQWRRNSVDLAGATSATLILQNVQPSSAGFYTVAVTNAVSTVVSNPASLAVNSAPAFSVQPHAQVAVAGSSVTFTASATGGNLSYQWRKNGVAIPGANSSSYTLGSVSAADAGNYDVFVSSPLGAAGSSLAQLTIVAGPTAPVITAQPAARTALVGSSVTLVAAASGAPAPTYQWRKNGGDLAGQTNSTLTLAPVQVGDAANYDVVISNSVGTVTSNPAGLRVITRSYAGIYFGSSSSLTVNFALFVREDNTGVFVGYLPSPSTALVSTNIVVSDGGQFAFVQSGIAVNISIGTGGTVSGSLGGNVSTSLAGTRSADAGPGQRYAGFYQAGSATGGAVIYTIANANGLAMVVAQAGSAADGGTGPIGAVVNNLAQITVSTGRTSITETIDVGTGTISGSAVGLINATFNGGGDTALARQRLLNISSRARVDTGAAVAIAGFVISGEESKPVLIRAVGPTLSSFGLSGVLASPRLELFRSTATGSTSVGVNTGIGTGASRANIDAAGVQAGAFALGTPGNDAAILTTLAPGNYTAQVSSNTNAAGVALIEVYDLSAPAPGQKMLNISTRAAAGTAENTLTAGFVVPAGSAKRVLIRGIGPGLAQFGVSGTLAQPVLTLLTGSTTLTSNTGYTTSQDRADLVTASAQVGGFPMVTADSALLVTLPPGNYTAQVVGANNGTGVALIEVYEVP